MIQIHPVHPLGPPLHAMAQTPGLLRFRLRTIILRTFFFEKDVSVQNLKILDLIFLSCEC